jgi:acetate kinase
MLNAGTKILVCNAGSSSLKFSLFEAQDELLLTEGSIDWTTEPTQLILRRTGQQEVREDLKLREHRDAAARIRDDLLAGPSPVLLGLGEIQAVGHRVVHGGERYTAAVRITPEVKRVIGELAELAPLHNPPSLEGIAAVEQVLPGVPQVAAFDTAFHATLSEAARTYPVPRKWRREWGVRRYGFHGLSHSYCTGRAAEMLGRRDLRLVIAHLGNGASVSAVRSGICVDTSMGFTPLEGLMMGTRSGTVDPGMLVHLMRYKGLDADDLDHALNLESGLLGVSGVSSDMREVLSELPYNRDARLAVDVYVHRIIQTIGTMAATLGGVDALVFTAGVGEYAPEIRRRACENLGFLGLELDRAANETRKPDADVALPASAARILIIATREDLTIMRETRRLLGSSPNRPHSDDRAPMPQAVER